MCRCSSRSTTCVFACVVIHVVIAVSLAAALVTRYYVYRDNVHRDMPTDQRVLAREESSIFCKSHIVKSFILDSTNSKRLPDSDEIWSNTKPDFDLYAFKDDPEHLNLTHFKVRKTRYIQGSSALLSKNHEYHHFNFLDETDVKITACTEYVYDKITTPLINDTTGLSVYFIEGKDTFDAINRAIEEGNEVTCHKSSCEKFTVKPTRNCVVSNNQTSFTNFSKTLSVSEECYVLFHNTDTKARGQKYRVQYELNRTEYDPPHQYSVRNQTSYSQARPDLYILLSFRQDYSQHEADNKLYNIETDYICESNTIVYVGIFFFVPLAVLFIFGVTVFCCYDGQVTRNDALLREREALYNTNNSPLPPQHQVSERHHDSTQAAVYT